jgi:hypothetical protein
MSKNKDKVMTFFSSPLFYILIGLIAGILLGKADTLFTNSRKNRKEADKIKGLEDQVTALQEQLTNRSSAPSAPPQSDLRLWTDPNGTLNLELDNAPVDAPASATPEQRRRLIALLTRLRPWIEGGSVSPAPKPAAPTFGSIPAPNPQPAQKPASVPKPVAPAEPRSGEAAIAPPPTTIVGQINAILQTRIVSTPLAAKRIQLTESPGGGVRVYVGMNFYEGVDTVPDAEVVAAIRAAIAEWEKKFG